jgi:hypothetical protein
MASLVPIVEGDGEREAAGILLRRLLYPDFAEAGLQVLKPLSANGRSNLTKSDGIEYFISIALRQPDAACILVLLDSDRDVPCATACRLRERIEARQPHLPVAVVCSEVEYESWFVDSIESVRGASGISEDAEPPDSAPANPKAWLTSHMPPGRAYKETTDQAPLTARLDFALLEERSRSFRRMRHAIEELVEAYDAGEAIVTPLRCDEED